MRNIRSLSSRGLPSIAVALVVVAIPIASAFSPQKVPLPSTISESTSTLPGFQSSFMPSASRSKRSRKQRTSSFASSQRGEDAKDPFWSIRNSAESVAESDGEGIVYRSDVPSDNNKNSNINNNNNVAWNLAKKFKERFLKLPPPPEDQFIMTGDIGILFLYAFSSHFINDSVVKGLLNNPKMTIPEAVRELDPNHDVVSLQHPVWVDLASNPNVPFGNPSVDHALEVSAREAFLNHWGPLLSTEGSACVALCTCWLVAGWFHRAFLFDNSTYCNSDRALTKTVETWLTSALLLACLATGTDWLVGHVPVLQSLFCVTCKSAANAGGGEFKAAMATTEGLMSNIPMISFLSLTQSDVLFIVDSLTVLIAWRWSAHQIRNTFR